MRRYDVSRPAGRAGLCGLLRKARVGMASLDEFVTSVQSNIEALRQAQTSMDGAKQQAEELSSQFQALGAESMATGAQGLKQGVEQAQGGVVPVITQLEQLITQAQGLKSLRGTGGAGTHTRPSPTPLDSAPAALKEPVAKVGDPVTAPEVQPDSHRKELQGNDDEGKTRLQRFGRRFVSAAEDLAATGKDLGKSGANVIADHDPHSYGQATVQPDRATPTISAQHQDIQVPDVVATAVVLSAFAIEGLSRIVRKKDNGE